MKLHDPSRVAWLSLLALLLAAASWHWSRINSELSENATEMGEDEQGYGAWIAKQRVDPANALPPAALAAATAQLDPVEAIRRERSALSNHPMREAAAEARWQALGPAPISNGQTLAIASPHQGASRQQTARALSDSPRSSSFRRTDQLPRTNRHSAGSSDCHNHRERWDDLRRRKREPCNDQHQIKTINNLMSGHFAACHGRDSR